MGHLRHALNCVGLLSFCGIALAIVSPAASAGTASFPIYVPQECVELALREGVPIIIENKLQAVKATLKLYRLRAGDPLVFECRTAVKRAQMSTQ
jgi:hypothetical protein